MDFGLSDEQKMIVDTVRNLSKKKFIHLRVVEATGVSKEVSDEIKKTIGLGFYACNFPSEVGGAGLNHLEFALVERELGRARWR